MYYGAEFPPNNSQKCLRDFGIMRLKFHQNNIEQAFKKSIDRQVVFVFETFFLKLHLIEYVIEILIFFLISLKSLRNIWCNCLKKMDSESLE